ncbi:hypothetical protein AU468_13770 [Alkalispirochaeta sphaeroplastigenens]|uniref:Uncharacterized protein n=1 Tax=Alkalispirochaeta sphaeroplastigenens TaxID=1187066 RepID=A0A2S4JFS6_9SPIO|nr:hypothetical protein AU468_13770 [Alkalispirochaeta sphaeroplastigenens]
MIEGPIRPFLGFSHVDVVNKRFCPRLETLGKLVQNVRCFMDPAALSDGVWEHLWQCFPKSQSAIANCQLRIQFQATTIFQLKQQVFPALFTFPVSFAPVFKSEKQHFGLEG